MDLSKTQVTTLLGLVASTDEDRLDCDECFGDVAEFADAKLTGKPLTDAMRAVETHLEQCPCCADEYQALLEGLRGLE